MYRTIVILLAVGFLNSVMLEPAFADEFPNKDDSKTAQDKVREDWKLKTSPHSLNLDDLDFGLEIYNPLKKTHTDVDDIKKLEAERIYIIKIYQDMEEPDRETSQESLFQDASLEEKEEVVKRRWVSTNHKGILVPRWLISGSQAAGKAFGLEKDDAKKLFVLSNIPEKSWQELKTTASEASTTAVQTVVATENCSGST